jgi:hypothetical protein
VAEEAAGETGLRGARVACVVCFAWLWFHGGSYGAVADAVGPTAWELTLTCSFTLALRFGSG